MDKRKEKALFLHTQLVAESEAAEVNVSPLRLQWSQLKAWEAQPYSRYKHIYVFLNLLIFFIVVVQYSLMAWFGRWVLYRILKRYQNKRGKKKQQTNKRSDEIVRWGRGGGRLMGESCLLQFVGQSVALTCPLLKNVSHAGQTHSSSIALLWQSALC